MRKISIEKAGKKMAGLITMIEPGESVAITSQGRPIAQLTPIQPSNARQLPDLSGFRQSIRVRGKGLSEAVIAGRRRERY
jgi:antitoxin (DNA-binding transcriptional repressor) of toxin-antitoxin stability system